MQDFFKWPDQSFDEMDSTLAAQQYIQQMIKKDHVDIDGILTAPAGQDEGVWKYEHLRWILTFLCSPGLSNDQEEKIFLLSVSRKSSVLSSH